ncbi:metal ABC transporter permease [Peptoniphilus raoultii]|uniref:metal ABC transporter permease n=1 Tax=Peptoniphilus raoultii TaxID=1776387 RepID=UPI0008DA9F0C|nr:metal ABC transporter permease [Peptoniphilus raoultii]
MEIFSYSYMIKAFICGFFLSLIIPLMGIVIVNKKISIIGDALSHVSLAGVMIGIFAGIQPMLGAIITCILASFFMEFIRKNFPGYQEISTAIVMSTGIGLASLMSGFIRTSYNFESFLFGSILTISNFEFYTIIILSLVIFFIFALLYRDLMYISFDESSAKLSGLKVESINRIFMFLIALTISISARTVGILIISSLMVIPVALSLQFNRGYLQSTILSSVFGIIFTLGGLFISFYLGLKPGGTIVIFGVIILIFMILLKKKR